MQNNDEQTPWSLKNILLNEVVLLCVFVVTVAGILWFSNNYFVITRHDAPSILKYSMITVFLLAFIAQLDNSNCK